MTKILDTIKFRLGFCDPPNNWLVETNGKVWRYRCVWLPYFAGTYRFRSSAIRACWRSYRFSNELLNARWEERCLEMARRWTHTPSTPRLG